MDITNQRTLDKLLQNILKTSKRAFNRAAAANNIKVENPRDVPEELHEMVVPRPVGLSLPERSKLEDFFLIFQEKRQNMGPYLIFSNLAGCKLSL